MPSNLYFTTSREHVELAGGRWVDVAVHEATEPQSPFLFKGNIDLARLEEVLAAAAPGEVAYVRQEACLNMAGGQPFSMENLAAVRELTLRARRPVHPRRDPDLRECALRQGAGARVRGAHARASSSA